MVHHLDPFAIQFTQNFGIRWYGLAYLAGFICGYWVIRYLAKKGNTPMKPDAVADFITLIAIGVLVGGRLGYCIFYGPELFTSFDAHFPYWGALKVNQGGMASHGGIIGVMLVCWLYGRKHKISVYHLFDLVTFGGSLGFFFGRIANYINGELYGRPAPQGLSWAVKFPQEMYLWADKSVHKLMSVGPAAQALGHIKTAAGNIPVDIATWQAWVRDYHQNLIDQNRVNAGINQLIQAVQHGNHQVTQALSLVLTPRYPSQLIQCLLEGLCVFLILVWIWRKPRKPGVVGAWFGILYAIARIIGEQYRMPDVQIGFQLFHLTRGQWLSIFMLVISVGLMIYVQTRDTRPMGGWSDSELAKARTPES